MSRERRIPDLFLVGAPKAGTTALAQYLSEHPQVFMSEPKEPNYFARHLTVPRHRRPGTSHTDLEAYLRLFESAGPGHRVLGEASTRYLRSRRALEGIRALSPEARIVVMLRNPVDLVQSWHGQKLYEGQETEEDFERAWRLEGERREGRHLPEGLIARDALFYAKVGSIGTQLERVLELFPAERVKVLFFDDLGADARRVYEDVLGFLGLESDGRTDFPVVNPARRLTRPRLARLLQRRPAFVQAGIDAVKRRLGLRDLGMSRAIERVVATEHRRPPLSPAFRAELVAFFAEEVRKVEGLTGRELPTWR